MKWRATAAMPYIPLHRTRRQCRSGIILKQLRLRGVRGGVPTAVPGGRGLHSFPFQLNLSRV
jgi:hypothetical protein